MKLENIKGIGPKTLSALQKLNINNLNDLLMYYPYRYQILRLSNIYDSSENSIAISAKVESIARVSYIKKSLNRLVFRAITSNKIINVTIFNRAFLKDKIIVGKEITLIGKYNAKTNSFVASDIKLYKLNNTEIESKYHLNKDIKSKLFNNLINSVLMTNFEVDDFIPAYLNKTYNFIDKKDAIKVIHRPTYLNLLKQAKLKLIYEELFIFMFKINYLKYKNSLDLSALARDVDYDKVMTFINDLPFSLTKDQQTIVDEIIDDFNSSKRMNRLVLGDVGSGKTIVSFIAMYANFLNNYQSALMAPTEVLAKQHFESIKNIFKNYDINIALLTSSTSKKDKEQIFKSLKDGSIDMIVGTHALLSEKIVFNNLGLVVTDEQHRFGVNQRSILQNKGIKVDVLYLSATPIPRTYALTLYGDMNTSIIKTKPKGRKEVITNLKKESEIKEVLNVVLEEIKKGHQIYVVAPSIEENEDNTLENVNTLKEKFNKAFNNIVKIGVLHGKQKVSEKEKTMNDFKDKKYNILISTTVIEVGVDVKNATVMIIFNAERFGLATLHQLRGRVGRNDLENYCFLISDYQKERLNVLCESNDGFYISQKDFELRGEGDLFGEKQSGDMSFKIANYQRDYKILLQAKKDSQEFLEENINDNFINYSYYQDIIKQLEFID